MFVCCACSVEFETPDYLINHLRNVHPFLDAFECKQSNCVRIYSTRQTFKDHLSSKHNILLQPCIQPTCNIVEADSVKNSVLNVSDTSTSRTTSSSTAESVLSLNNSLFSGPSDNAMSPSFSESEHISSLGASSSSNVSPEEFKTQLSKSALIYVAGLYQHDSVTRSFVQTIIDGHKEFISSGMTTLKKRVQDALTNCNCNSNEMRDVMAMFQLFESVFDFMDTEHKRIKAFTDCGAYVAPKQYDINTFSNEREFSNPTQVNVVVSPEMLTGQFVPIDIVLRGFLEIDGVLSQILSYMDLLSAENDIMENVVQGDLWKTKIKPRFVGKTVLPLTLSFDDYEPDNSLGSHANVHKLGAAYLEISCLPSEYQGALENKFLALLFHSSDRCVGNKAVFRPLINILKVLETDGITIVTSNGVYQLHFALVLVVGDNLGVHGILGFMEAFSANFPCHICKVSKTVVRRQIVADLSLLRNKKNYQVDVSVGDGSVTGVNEECVFNCLDSFHCCENVYGDIMHDTAEGVFKYGICSILNYLTRKQYFDYETLNDRVQSFAYGASEYGNKPPIICQESVDNESLNFSAAEMFCFVRYFGLIVGEFVPEDEPVWEFYCAMVSILDILCSPSISSAEIQILSNLISRHHELYIDLFHQHLKPKHHFMIHYPYLIKQIGPLIRVWCMRFESKHREGKMYAQVCFNRINLPKSVSVKHQLKVCFRFITQSGLVKKLEYSALDSALADSEDFYEFCDVVPNFLKSLTRVTWLTTNHVKYSIGMTLVIALGEEYPVFGSIHSIIVDDKSKDVYFIVSELLTLKFCNHVHAYEVKFTKNMKWVVVPLKDLITYQPSVVRPLNGKHYVTCRSIL